MLERRVMELLESEVSSHVVVRVHARHVAQRGLRLGGDELLVVVDVEQRLGGVLHVPHHDVGDLDGVAHLVVDLQDLAVQRAGADRDLGGQAGRRLGSGLDGLGERQPALADALATASSAAELVPMLRL